MYRTNLVVSKLACGLMDLQKNLKNQYPDYNIEGLSALPLSDGKVKLTIESEKRIPENLNTELSNKIPFFVPIEEEEREMVLSASELTDLISLMFAKLAEKDVIDNEATMKYSKILQHGRNLSKETMNIQ